MSAQLPNSEFEKFVEDAAGSALPVYGRQLFSGAPSTFAPMDQIPVPANYVLGPGDQIVIRVWGKIEFESTVTVDRNGQIFVPKVGTLGIAGLRFDQLQGFLESAIGNLYKDFELNVTMGQLRAIQIFVLGSARQPGAYTVSSLSTLVNALFASGGPSANGSMRHIQLRRNGQQVTEFDIYDLLRRGDKSKDVQLLPGDVIYIPPVGAQVALIGSVNEPGIYELKGEATLAAELEDAGGLTNLAGDGRVLLERIEDHRRRRVDEFILDAAGLKRPVENGDMVHIFSISPQFDNAITLRGNVAQPGRFRWNEGMRVKDLIPSRDFLISGDYWHEQNSLAAPSAHSDVMNDIAQASTEINWDYASIERLDKNNLSTRVIAFNLGKAIDDPGSTDNQILEAGDILTIYSGKDLPLPADKRPAYVRITGEVNAPGVYQIDAGETLQEVVRRAGGLTTRAYLYASELTRVSTREEQEKQLQLSIEQLRKDIASRLADASTVTGQNGANQAAQQLQEQAAMSQLSAYHPTGRIVLGIRGNADTIADLPAFSLEDGDTFYVPPRSNTVQVQGAVYNQNAFRYVTRKRVSAYLSDAGGAVRQADTKRIYVIRADGTVVSAQNRGKYWREDFNSLALLPGDAVVVPVKVKTPNAFLQQLPYFTSILSQTAMTGAVLGTTY
jgi:protein involved in polysaccharide export with SLBB domain